MINDKILYDLDDNFGHWWECGFSTPSMTKNLYPYTKMFSPIKVNKLTLKNRLVMGPMGNIDMAEETGRPSQKMISYFTERAKGGVGLITSGLVPVSYGIDPTVKELGDLSYFPRIDRSRTVYSGWREVAASVHANGAHFFIQLTAGLGRVGNPQCLLTQFKIPVSASCNPNFYIPQIPCIRISGRKLNKLVKNFGQAAADAKASNIDGVYLHGHEGYLLEQLTNPAFNRRALGKYSDWQRFGVDAVKEIRDEAPPDLVDGCGLVYHVVERGVVGPSHKGDLFVAVGADRVGEYPDVVRPLDVVGFPLARGHRTLVWASLASRDP